MFDVLDEQFDRLYCEMSVVRKFKWVKNELELQAFHPVQRIGYFHKRIQTVRPCLSNDEVRLIVWVFTSRHVKFHYTVELTGAVNIDGKELDGPKDQTWVKLQAYSVETLDNLEVIERSLVKAWEALVS